MQLKAGLQQAGAPEADYLFVSVLVSTKKEYDRVDNYTFFHHANYRDKKFSVQ